ncbi:MAG TPA: acetyl-CoA C-acyltransferase [Gammaproteobacteria bacterium]|nr:acetyl-CoA C-acyltransferase [Gammaproteobacteria bacterium]
MRKDSVVIVSIARTPQGNLLGALKDFSAPELGGIAIRAALSRANLSPDAIQEVIMGCVLSAGLGQAPARQAAHFAGIPASVPCTTINKMCGSGMKAVMLAHDAILADTADILVAGGMESMSNAPYLIPKARQGYRLGHADILDHMAYDGLEDAYDKGKPMGFFAEHCAARYHFSREDQDQFARESLLRAKKAAEENAFQDEIIPVTQKENVIDRDEHPHSVNLEKIPKLQPVFLKDGTITAASSSSIADGAAALVLMRESDATRRHIQPLAKIIAHTTFARAPGEFTIAPIDAIKKLLKKTGWTIDEVDLFEINEAFAVVAMAAMRELSIPHDKLNIYGGGLALGHPIGATGARILVTLVSALKKNQLKKGIAALCIGGGEATAIAIECV